MMEAQLIRVAHFLIVIAWLASIFVPNAAYKNAAVLFLLFVLFQFSTNYGKCGLTQLEYWITGREYENGFIYRLMNPYLKVTEDYFDKGYYIVHISYIFILLYQLDFKLTPLW